MNPHRKADLERKLAASEQSLTSRLRVLLPDTAAPASSLFTTTSLSHGRGLVYCVPPVREELHFLSGECVALRKKLALPVDGTVAQAFIEACSGSSVAVLARRRLVDLLHRQLAPVGS